MHAYKRLFSSCAAALLALPVCCGSLRADYADAEDGPAQASTTMAVRPAANSLWSDPPSDSDTLGGQLRSKGRVTVINPDGVLAPSGTQLISAQSQSPCSGADDVCSTCQQSPCCCPCSNYWKHRCFVFGEYLYLKSYGPDFVHASQYQTANPANPPNTPGNAPLGTAQNLIQPWQGAFRVGAGYALTDCSSITATYTQFQSHTTDFLGAPNGGAIPTSVISSVLVPGTTNAGTVFSNVIGSSGIAFRTGDIMYSRLLAGGDNYYVNYDIGARYAHLEQGFSQTAQFAQAGGPMMTNTNIRYDGAGLRTGFDGRRRLGCGGFSCYGNGFLSVLFGDFNSNYTQTNPLASVNPLAANNWESARVMPILEYEVGVSWTSCGGCWRIGAGYYTAFWFNAVTNPQYIQSVQANNFVKVGDTITFTGLVAHAEMRF